MPRVLPYAVTTHVHVQTSVPIGRSSHLERDFPEFSGRPSWHRNKAGRCHIGTSLLCALRVPSATLSGVHPLVVVLQHARSREPPLCHFDAGMHHADPYVSPVLIGGDDIARQHLIQRGHVHAIAVAPLVSPAELPAVDAVVTGLGPPPVERTQVEDTIHRSLHA